MKNNDLAAENFNPDNTPAAQDHQAPLAKYRWALRGILWGWATYSMTEILGLGLFNDPILREDIPAKLFFWSLMGLVFGLLIKASKKP